ncbi:MAG: hypothetical protein KKH20_07695 [Proteobacteria bacterium]|nr:hypothetical protein [Desulfobacteraceae bacterium]MBU4067439.1 hypothetical protein [Pseudomonadota bacterium]MBU4101246.1 hypothetical protein [Pseudomonadota bacterium]MBU4128136.1 hypothetical protein [Pseudomonadota bacterium]
MQLCFDIDNVIANTDPIIRRIIYQHTGGRVDLKREDVIEFDYCSCPDKNGNLLTKSEWYEVHNLFSKPEIISSIDLFPGVPECLKRLSTRYEIYIATSRLLQTRSATVSWLKKNQINEYKIHFIKSGRKHETLGLTDIIVEDHYEQAAAFAQNGTKCFIIEYPWNSNKPARQKLEWVKGWDELMVRLLD